MKVRGHYITDKKQSEILEKVKQHEYKKRCVDARICPKCGEYLSFHPRDRGGRFSNKVCRECNITWD